MLRASSLNLSLLSPTIFAAQTCRRLCGHRSRLLHAPNGLSFSLTLAPAKEAYRFNSATTYQIQGSESGENLRVLNASENSEGGLSTVEPFLSTPLVEVVEEAVEEETTVTLPAPDASLPPAHLQRSIAVGDFMLEEDVQTLAAEKGPTTQHVISDPPPFAAGRPWAMKDIKTVGFAALSEHLRFIKEDIDEDHRNLAGATASEGSVPQEEAAEIPSYEILALIRDHIRVLGESQSVEAAWHAYISLIDYISRVPHVYRHLPYIPFSHLHRLCRLIARNRPRTHRQFRRLLAVMTYVKHCGGKIHQHEYNALVDHAGQGWRKTRKEEVEHALRVFRELKQGRLPGYRDDTVEGVDEGKMVEGKLDNNGPAFEADIYTYTSLLSIASRAMDTSELLNISTLMTRAGLPPNRITHLALLAYFTKKNNLGGVRSTLQKMRAQNLELGLDGLNACMWAYGHNSKVDIAMMIYRLLRHNIVPETYIGEDDIQNTISQLAEEYIFVEADIRPNEVTYTMSIQIMAYHGHFRAVLNIFTDMLSFENMEQGAPLYSDQSDELKPAPYHPSVAVFRSIFLGFSKFGVPPDRVTDADELAWRLENLGDLFERFLYLPQDSVLTYNTVDIILKAFAVTSDWNIELMRDVWLAIERRFDPLCMRQKGESRLVKLKAKLFANAPTKPG